jgi:uncharacterized protein with HEPN domain
MQRDLAYVIDIFQAARLVRSGIVGITQEAFFSDWLRQSAIVRQFEIMGEATKRLSAEFTNNHPEIPWHSMAGMRDMLIHEYDSVDFEEVWRTAQYDIPQLIELLEPLIPPQE